MRVKIYIQVFNYSSESCPPVPTNFMPSKVALDSKVYEMIVEVPEFRSDGILPASTLKEVKHET